MKATFRVIQTIYRSARKAMTYLIFPHHRHIIRRSFLPDANLHIRVPLPVWRHTINPNLRYWLGPDRTPTRTSQSVLSIGTDYRSNTRHRIITINTHRLFDWFAISPFPFAFSFQISLAFSRDSNDAYGGRGKQILNNTKKTPEEEGTYRPSGNPKLGDS